MQQVIIYKNSVKNHRTFLYDLTFFSSFVASFFVTESNL